MHVLQTKTFSPKELAEAIGVSESSIKRWVDAGLIRVTRTAGGHRRILMSDALRFIRGRDMRVLRPDLLGLPDLQNLPAEAREGELTDELLFHLLSSGEAAQARGVVAAAYLDGLSVAQVWDGPVAGALARLGELWLEDERGVYTEHRATTVCIEALQQVRLLIPPPAPDAPLALGGAPAGDPYLLPTLAASAVLADAGYREVNLGPNTPVGAFLHAVEESPPSLVWLAMTAPVEEAELKDLRHRLLPALGARGVEVVAGGRSAAVLGDAVRQLSSMQDLEAFAGLREEKAR